MSRKLLVSDGKRERELVLVEKIVVGRDPTCDVSHEDALLSRRHAEFTLGDEGVTVRDLGSRNGIFVNGFRAAERQLVPGDVVQIGPLRVRYAVDSVPASILPEQLIGDATIVLPPPVFPPPAPVPPPPVEFDDGDDQTRAFSPVAVQAVRPAAPRAALPSDSELHGDGPTQFLPFRGAEPVTPDTQIMPPRRSRGSVAPPASRPAPPPESTPGPTPLAMSTAVPIPKGVDVLDSSRGVDALRAVEAEIRTHLFGQLIALAGIVLISASVPLMMWRGQGTPGSGAAASYFWLLIPLAAAVFTTYLVGRTIHARFVRILRAWAPHLPPGPEPFRGVTGNSPGLPHA